MRLLVTGVSHKTAPVELRERLAVSEAEHAAALTSLTSLGAAEALVLSTCNRVEIAVATPEGADPRPIVPAFFDRCRGVPAAVVEPHLYRYEGREAIHHIFRVAASLDSMIVGEPQILGQLKAAYCAAKGQGALGGRLEGVLSRAFSVAKRVRSETGVAQMAVSVSYAAVELARRIFGSLDSSRILIAGAGKMSELAARHLRRSGGSKIWVTNRTYERAVEMAAAFQGTAVEWERFPAMLPEIDILIASTASPNYILGKADVERVIAARKNRPVFIIDIAVPRNIDPAVNQIENVFLYDIDDLQEVVQANLQERKKEAGRAEVLVAAEVDRMMARLCVREVAPTIVCLQEQLEQIRAAEMERMRRKFGPLTPGQEEAWEALTRGIVNKIAHGPIAMLRTHAGQPGEAHVVEAIRKAFQLEN
jgi:glutamyl-tRNA reductase